MDRFIKAALASAILLLPTYALVQEQTPTSDTPLAQAAAPVIQPITERTTPISKAKERRCPSTRFRVSVNASVRPTGNLPATTACLSTCISRPSFRWMSRCQVIRSESLSATSGPNCRASPSPWKMARNRSASMTGSTEITGHRP